MAQHSVMGRRLPRLPSETVGRRSTPEAHLRPYDLRHTAVALWIAAGADPKLIAERAGHTSVSIVLDRYGHLYPDASERLNEALDAMGRSAAIRAGRLNVVPLGVARS